MKNTLNIKAFFFMALFFALIGAMSVFSITASISNPRMVLRVNVSRETPGYLQNSIIVNNNNDYEILIEVQADDVLNSLNAELSETRFKLMPNESRNINFKLTIANTGLYDGKLYVSFRGKPSNATHEEQVGLTAGIVVIASGENYTGIINTKPKPTPTQNQIEEQNLTGQTPNNKTPETSGNQTQVISGELISKGANPFIGILIIIIVVGIGVLLFVKMKRK